MKNTYKQFIILIVFYLLCLPHVAAQSSSYAISEPKSNHMKLSGTSSLHDWDMNAHIFTGKAEFDFKKGDDQTLIGLNSLNFSLPVTNLKSDKKGLDKNAYNALNTDKHKNIIYTLLTAKVSPEKEGKFLIKTTGNLSISGVTREVAMDVYCVVNKDASISCSGTEELKMTDYKVEPPSFMFGAMKTGDAITLDFTMVYTNINLTRL
jgi:polyisoprenoid-binding protein YceI